ncbi:MAG TPA: hypothetical protein VFO19_08350 [Vicinamibacterales bacterium]|nr:hypothetical protein [Vicinamibacterales bacterium]
MSVSAFRVSVVLAGLVAIVSCGGSSPSGPSSSGGGGSDAPVTISIVGDRGNQSFSPNPAIAAGRMVVFRNNDAVAHRVRLNDLSVDWGIIQPGATSAAFRMPDEGTNYHCDLHAGMIGAVSIDAATPPPPCRGDYC